MLMEAVIESLRDGTIQNPPVEQPPLESSDKDDSSYKISKPIETETTSAASDVCEPLKVESNAAPLPPSHSDSSASKKCSSEIDISYKTKATLTVIRNPAGHVMNGLMRRWDFNFLRNSHNRLK